MQKKDKLPSYIINSLLNQGLKQAYCKGCKEYLCISLFSRDLKKFIALKSLCKPCAIKKYKKKNRKKINAYCKKYINKNRSKINQRRRESMKNSPIKRLKRNLSRRLGHALKTKYYKKTSRTHQMLGADYETVFEHLKATAEINYGAYCPAINYHIDHIIPCSTAKTEEELIKLQHYSNLQFLTPDDNIAKSDKLDYITPYMELQD